MNPKRRLEISEIQLAEAKKTAQTLFHEDFKAERLSTPGSWVGPGRDLLHLKGTVTESQFLNLLHGRAPDGMRKLLQTPSDPGTVVGWKLAFRAPENVSVLWALSSAEARHRIERIYSSVVRATVADFSSRLGGSQIRTSGDHRPQGVFASFMYGADSRQNPELSSNVYLMNLGLHPDGKVERFCRAAVARETELNQVHERQLYEAFSARLGRVVPSPGKQEALFTVTKELRDKYSQASGPNAPSEAGAQSKNKALRHDELFAQWQLQADQAGVGRSEVESVLASAQVDRHFGHRVGRLQHAIQRLASKVQHRLVNKPKAIQAASASVTRLSQRQEGASQEAAQKQTEIQQQRLSH